MIEVHSHEHGEHIDFMVFFGKRGIDKRDETARFLQELRTEWFRDVTRRALLTREHQCLVVRYSFFWQLFPPEDQFTTWGLFAHKPTFSMWHSRAPVVLMGDVLCNVNKFDYHMWRLIDIGDIDDPDEYYVDWYKQVMAKLRFQLDVSHDDPEWVEKIKDEIFRISRRHKKGITRQEIAK